VTNEFVIARMESTMRFRTPVLRMSTHFDAKRFADLFVGKQPAH
jgi:hypothetical protein